MATIYKWRRMVLPTETHLCIQKLNDAAHRGVLTGLAFVALLDGNGYVAETCGEASNNLEDTIKLLQAFEAKLTKRHMSTG